LVLQVINKTYIPIQNFENRVTIEDLCESHISKTCDYVITDVIFSKAQVCSLLCRILPVSVRPRNAKIIPTPLLYNGRKTVGWLLYLLQDLTDEAYLKRHQRLEVDEKRRKRWDLQRQRELSIYEHLRRDDSQHAGGGHSPSQSSIPDIDDSMSSWSCLSADLLNIVNVYFLLFVFP